MGFRATKRTKLLLKKWLKSEIKLHSNQLTFQKAVYDSKANGKILPLRYFPNGKLFFEQMPKMARDEVVVIHNNFIVGKAKKIQRFQYFMLWQPLLKGNYA